MPRAPKQCAEPGCTERVVAVTHCRDHKRHGWVNGGTTRTSTPEHRAWRKAVLDRDRGSCQIRGPKCIGRALEADHIVPAARGGALYDVNNGQAACVPCHRSKTAQEGVSARSGGTPPPPPGVSPPR